MGARIASGEAETGGSGRGGAVTAGGAKTPAGRPGSRRRTALLAAAVLILAPLATVAAEPASGAAPVPAAPYRIGYAGGAASALAAVDPATGTPRPRPDPTEPAEDPSARGAGLVFVTRRPGHVDGDLSYRAPGARAAVPLLADGFDDRHPQLSPDGGAVAFESNRGGQIDIWVIGVDGTGLRRITDHPADDTWPTWSPTGDRIAFSSTRDDPAGDLYVARRSDGVVTRLTDDPAVDTQPAWSSTGVIAFTTTRFQPGAAAAAPAAGAPPARLPAPAPALAPAPPPQASPTPGTQDPTPPVPPSTSPPPTAPAPTPPTVVDLSSADLATITDTGAGLRRLVRGEQAAWSPDGTRLAYVSRTQDPAGDLAVLTLASGAVTAPAARPQRGETHPTWAGATLVYADTTPGDGTSDIFSVDPRGQDRRDHTNRPDGDETGPAFSADGRSVAYAEQALRTGEGPTSTRIVVAGADGRDPRPLTAFVAGRHDLDPTWSPDGTMIAFSRELPEESSTVVIVRVADGVQLGTVEVPAALDADDQTPAWSPDGRHIAFSRQGRLRPPTQITPGPTDRRVNPGGSSTVEQVMHTPAIPPNPDIVLLVDTTGSMGSAIANVQANLGRVVQDVRNAQPNAEFAVASYRDEGDGAELFRVHQDLTPDPAAVQSVVDHLTADGGGDVPEAWANALDAVSTGRISFRPGSSRIVVMVGDAPSHDPSNRRTLTQAIDSLRGAGVRVVAVNVGLGAMDSILSPPGCRFDCLGQATRVVAATSGTLVSTGDPGEVSNAILSGLHNLEVTVTPVVRSCDPGLTVTFDPTGSTTVVGGRDVRYRQTMTVAAGVTPGTVLHCDVVYRPSPSPDGNDYLAPVTVRVNDPDLPLVTVDDITVPTAGPDGAVVTYPAAAVDAAGAPLVPTCRPVSGGTFPIGQTLVTCTATDADGRVGQDTALVTVVDQRADGSTRIWVATVEPTADGPVVVDAQVDLSVHVGEACPARRLDLAPAWAPAGAALAFTADGVLCVVDPTGVNARVLVTPVQGQVVEDPAFSPDGTLIAYGWDPGGELSDRSIRTVPAAGGAPTAVVEAPGDAFQPAFWPLSAGLSLSVSATPPRTSVGGAPITVTFTAVNLATLPAERVWLAADIPSLPPRATLLDTLAPGGTVTISVDVPATAPVLGTVHGRLTGVFPVELTVTATAQTDIEVAAVPVSPTVPTPPSVPPGVPVFHPVLTLVPQVGPPGFVAIATGSGFPPHSVVTFTWSRGISAPTRAVAGADGTVATQMLIFHKDQLGPRDLVASGTGYAPATAGFLVVPGNQQPNDFVSRG